MAKGGRKVASRADLRIIGFDLGHAESALVEVNDPRSDEFVRLELPSALGRQYVTVTAVAQTDHGILIGYPAVDEPDVLNRYVGFKSPALDKEAHSKPTEMFVAQMRDELIEAGRVSATQPTRWVFGAPSGWSDKTLRTYAKVLKSAGLNDVEVIAESRAAMLYARDAGEIEVSQQQLEGAVLVVDLGSSTTDFTAIIGLKVRPVDTGTALGAGLIDKAIMNWLLETHPKRADLERWLSREPFEEPRLELACRWAKEDYFRNLAASRGERQVRGGFLYVPINADDLDNFMISIKAQDMEQILAVPHPVLSGRNWMEAFEADLRTAAAGLDSEPEVVLLTGGASRMPFVRQIARDIFGGETVKLGAEPEVAIAKGLALAGRIGVRADGFRSDMRRLLSSGQVESLVEGRVPQLAEGLGNAVASGFMVKFARPAFRRWQEREIVTLNNLERQIALEAADYVADPNNPAILEAIAQWQNELRPDLADLTRSICTKWSIPPSAMELEPVSLGSRDWNMAINLGTIIAGSIGNIAGWIAGSVVGAIIIALAVAGAVPSGGTTIFVGWIAAMGAGGALSDWATKKVRDADVYLWVRKGFSADTVFKNQAQQERELAGKISSAITGENADAIVAQVSRRLEAELKELASAAELLVT
jgi:hypothetical protein